MNWDEVKNDSYGYGDPFNIKEYTFKGYQFHISYQLLVVVMIVGLWIVIVMVPLCNIDDTSIFYIFQVIFIFLYIERI